MSANVVQAPVPAARARLPRMYRKVAKRVIPLVLALYFIPIYFAVLVALGLLDFMRNRSKSLSSFDRYFAGNGVCTWLLCPLNLLLDMLALPYRNKGIYQLADLPASYQDEIKGMIEAAHRSDLVGKLSSKLEDHKRGMIFFKWYGKNVQTSIDVPEFHRKFKYIRTIGVSIFRRKQSTGKHFGPLRISLRLLYNMNQIDSDQVYIKVGNHTNYWRENKLFIFDDTLEHQSCNESDEVRYCLFVDILRPSLFPGLLSALLTCVRVLIARFNFAFYRHWVFIK
jgi:aspartyl/asparaginyl beta-hydroxylase (cupin superfamily)